MRASRELESALSRLTELEATIAQLKAVVPAKFVTVPRSAQNLSSENDREAVPRITPVPLDVKQRQQAIGKVAPKNYGVLPSASDKGLSQTTLCNLYGLSWRNLKRNLAVASFDTVEGYFQQMRGTAWT